MCWMVAVSIADVAAEAEVKVFAIVTVDKLSGFQSCDQVRKVRSKHVI